MPQQPDTRLSGILKISDSCEITVELAGMLDDPLVTPKGFADPVLSSREDVGPERIVGVLHEGGSVTLDGCLRQNSSFSLPSGLSTSTIYAERALIGAQYGEEEEILFSEVDFSIEGLDTWLSVSGIETQVDIENKTGSVNYHVPDDITLELSCGTALKFRFRLTGPVLSLFQTEAVVKQTAQVLVKFEKAQPIEECSSMAFKLCNFLTLALDEAVSIQSMTGYLEQETTESEKRQLSIRVYSQFGPWPESKPKSRWHDALFRYPNVAHQLNAMMVKWFENYEALEPSFNLYFASRTQSSLFLDTKILWLTQALEALHRRTSDETEMSVEEFDSLRKSAMLACPMERREWLNNRLRYANELPFRRRMWRLLKPFERWFGDRTDRRAFINRVCDTRNYLTHYDEESTTNRAIGADELFGLYQKLEALFQLHLLNLIGLDASVIESIIQENHSLRRKLGIQSK